MHTAVEYSDSFRPEFKDAVEAITSLTALSQRHNPTLHLPTVAMSATFRIPEQKSLVAIMCTITGNPLNQLAKDLAKDAADEKDSQFLVYSNSTQACEENVIERIESKLGVVPKEYLEGKVMCALTGKLGIMGKSFLAEAFARKEEDNTLPTIMYAMHRGSTVWRIKQQMQQVLSIRIDSFRHHDVSRAWLRQRITVGYSWGAWVLCLHERLVLYFFMD